MTALLTLENIRVNLGGRTVVDGVSLTLQRGELVLVMGRSGTGKSVLIKAALGFLPRAGGRVCLEGAELPATALRERVTLVHQAAALLDERSAWDNVREPLQWRGVSARDAGERATDALQRCGVPRPWSVRAAALSGGDRKRVCVARAVAQRPAALLLDEPTTGLDAASARRVGLLCGRLAREGMGLLVVTHDLAPFAGEFSRCILLHEGRVVADQPAAAVQSDPHPALRQLLDGAPQGPLTHALEAHAP